MEDEAQAENVADGVILSLHVLDVDDLRSHIAGSSAAHEEILLGIAKLCKSEVSDDALSPAVLGAEDEVFRLEIAMHSLLGMHLLESLEDGVDDQPGLVRLEFVFGLDFVVELASFKELDHDVERVLRLEDLVEFHAALVAQGSHYLYFLD
jgi:hypothetical protein